MLLWSFHTDGKIYREGMTIVNMTAPKMYLALHSSKHQHGGSMIFQVEIVGGVK